MAQRMLASGLNRQILIVDRDVGAVEPLRLELGEAGFIVRVIADASAAIAAVAERPPHLVVIDWNMPRIDALEVIERVRRARAPQAVRLIILSALSGEQDVVAGLNLGADDYIAKPFSLREAVARVCAVLRAHPAEDRATLSCAGLVIDGSTNRVTAQGRQLNLRGIEYRLLEFLMSHPGRAFSRTQLLAQVWGGDNEVDERTVDVNVQRLRKILAQPGCGSYIQTVRGFGYRFAAPAASEAMSAPSHF
jgi:two-component system phosphate regulon response regulator PhoB